MKHAVGIIVLTAFTLLSVASVGADVKKGKPLSGAVEFKEHCAVCHPEGGNIVNPQKTLRSKDLAANGIKKPADIIKKMRAPGPGMTQFDKKTIPDKEAQAIAQYILKTFK
ncbi:MAG TPA: c-type cytochrome [Dissulfurispiraceae bacterium]|nr:c-type cytochrome [Dissulfurispiraceae bacterium]